MKYIGIFLFFLPLFSTAQDVYSGQREEWMEKAAFYKPNLKEENCSPKSVVIFKKAENSFQGWAVDKVYATTDYLYQKSFKNKSGIILDFGKHLTGYFSFKTAQLGAPADSPVRLKFTFGEVPSEVSVPYDPYNGTLSRA